MATRWHSILAHRAAGSRSHYDPIGAIGAPMWPAERVDYERNLAIAQAQLDDAAWQAEWAKGRAMSIEQAAAYAVEIR